MTKPECQKVLEGIMDKRDTFFKMLKSFYDKHGNVPPQHEKSLYIGQKENWKPWREQPATVRMVKRAAKKASKAKGLQYLSAKEMEKAMEQLMGMGANVK
jgi:hypothetical protein